ncbi:MAG: DUF1648 domain-containing protein [Oscillospiraceae bacterium]|nr:DUF1648 domain-containing protein [Oscillospiraceae bacterium]
MIKKNKWNLLFSSIVILLPIVFGLVFWDKLPEELTTHWGADGQANGWMTKGATIFILPLILLAFHWLCFLASIKLPGGNDQNPKLLGIVLWIIPIISLAANGTIYAVAYGKEINPVFFVFPLLGILFIVIGNYLPKAKRNISAGIKVKWALQNEENWYATHRFGGKVYVIGGFFLLACMFLPTAIALWAGGIALVVQVFVPVIYSYVYYKKQVKAGSYEVDPLPCLNTKAAKIISLVTVPIVLVLIAVIMLTGNIEVSYTETAFTIEANFWSDLTVEYDAITSIEYREDGVPGSRTNGIGSARLLVGIFQNEEFGNYTRYTYTGSKPCVVLDVEGKILVINGIDKAATKAIYDTLKAKIG